MSKPPADWIRSALVDAYAALQAGDLGTTGALVRRVLDAAPALVEAHFLVGMVALELRDHRTARSAFSTVARLRPRHDAAWAQLAWLHARGGRTADARAAIAEARAWFGGNPAVADRIGAASALCGLHADALAWHRRAVSGAPDRIDYRINSAGAAIVSGAFSDARADLDAVLRTAPDHAQAHWLRAGLDTATDRQHADVLQRLLNTRTSRAPLEIALLAYARGKRLEDIGAWGDAFAAYAEGAKARRGTVSYDEAAEATLFDALIRRFDRDWLSARRDPATRDDASDRASAGSGAPAADRPACVPVFIVGQPRTGTTLVERMLAAHSQVQALGELQQFGRALRRLVGRPTPAAGPARDAPQGEADAQYTSDTQPLSGAEHRSDAERLRRILPGGLDADLVDRASRIDPARLGAAYLDAVAPERDGSPWFIDKLPGNFLHLPLILAALPEARIVHLVRDPLDACFASFKQLFAEAYPHSYDQAEQARHFVRYHRLMAHWRAEFPERFLDLSYEQLVTDPDAAVRVLLDHLGLPDEDAVRHFAGASGPVATASAVQVRSPVHARSVGQAHRLGDALAPMRAILAAAGLIPDPPTGSPASGA
ncbi:MAG: tetratricopeptide repeat-containing sulfotransferase family protein [Gammaproteobacteria bacterium]